jgi:two-component system chemotaxis sensor kinase CheA
VDEWRYIVVVGLAEQRLGVIVDSLLGQKEVVIKSLGSYLGKVPGIAGSTILGDGRVIMIIDVGEFMQLSTAEKDNGQIVTREAIAV